MFKIFGKLREGISSFLKSSVEYEEADQESAPEPKKPDEHHGHVTNYSLADIFAYKIYLVQTEEQLECIEFCSRNQLEAASFGVLNNRGPEDRLLPGQRVVVPSDSRLKPLLDLTLLDLKRFDLERRLMHLSVHPQYFMYYNTVHGDILGSVLLLERELAFEPLNANFKGHFNPVADNHNTSYMTSLKIAYEDIAGLPLLIPCPSSEPQEPEDLPLMYHLQLNLRHTGYFPYMSPATQALVLKVKGGVASIDFKGMVRDITGVWWKNEERKKNGLVFVNRLKEAIQKAQRLGSSSSIGEDDGEQLGNTCVPFFDIEYSSILAEATGQTGKGYRATFAKINQHLPLFKDIFGLQCVDKSISELRNQSFVPLECLFPEVQLERDLEYSAFGKEDEEDLLSRSIQEGENKKRRRMRKYEIPASTAQPGARDLKEGSEIATRGVAKLLEKSLPAIFSGQDWRLVFSKKGDGSSLHKLLSKVRGRGEALLLLMDTHGRVFGGYLPCELEFRNSYFGTGEAFLFRVEADGEHLLVYPASMDNLMFVYCSSMGIGLGADPHFGLFVDADLARGSSHPCKTFSNEVLAQHSHFTVKRMELWAFRDPF